jgi:hypothetical protein
MTTALNEKEMAQNPAANKKRPLKIFVLFYLLQSIGNYFSQA